jgi:hypothetical protein
MKLKPPPPFARNALHRSRGSVKPAHGADLIPTAFVETLHGAAKETM